MAQGRRPGPGPVGFVRWVRSPAVRALAFALSGHVQVSCNLLDAARSVGPAEVKDRVSRLADVERCRAGRPGAGERPAVDPEQRWQNSTWIRADHRAPLVVEYRLRRPSGPPSAGNDEARLRL